MTVRAKTLVKDKFWIVEQNGQKLGTLQKKENNILEIYKMINGFNHSRILKIL